MKRPDYRTLQALDAVIRERGFERAAQKLCITQSAVSQRIKQLENMFGQPLLVRTVPPRPTEQGQKLLALLRQVELLEEEWLGDEQTGSTPLLLSLAVNADSLATWLLPALAPVLADSPIRLNLQVEDETRTQERLRRGEVVGAVSIQHQALPSCLVDKLGALDYLFVQWSRLTILTICTRPFCSKTSICLQAAYPAISLILQKRSYNLLARAPPAV